MTTSKAADIHSLFAKPPDRAKQNQCLLLIGIVLLSAVLRVPGLGHDSLWFDEALTHKTADLPVSQVFASVRHWENAPPLYFYFINFWTHIFGDSDFMLRLPSALFAIASVAMMYKFARRLAAPPYPDRFALIAAFFLAISRYHIAYSQQARHYTLLLLLCLISCDAFVQLLQSIPTRRTTILYVLSSAAMLWTHPLSGFVLLAQNAYFFFLLLASPPAISPRHWFTLQGIVLILFGPWIGPMILLTRIGNPWMREPHFADTLLHYADTLPLLILLAILIALNLWRGIVKRDSTVLFALLLFLLPFAIPIIVSTAKHPLFVPRYGFPTLIGLYLLAAGGAIATNRIGTWIVIMIFTAFAAPHVLHDLLNGTTAEYRIEIRPAAQVVTRQALRGDGIYIEYQDMVFNAYLTRTDLIHLDSIPPAPDGPPQIWLVIDPKINVEQLLTTTPYHLVARYDYDGLSLAQARR